MTNLVRYIEVCHCGHSKSAHYEEKHTCLGMLCECDSYTDRDDPKPKTVSIPFKLPFSMDFASTPTPVMPSGTPTHPTGCTCAVCAYSFGTP